MIYLHRSDILIHKYPTSKHDYAFEVAAVAQGFLKMTDNEYLITVIIED